LWNPDNHEVNNMSDVEKISAPAADHDERLHLRSRIRAIRWTVQLGFLAVFLISVTGTVCTVILGSSAAISEPFGVLQTIFARTSSGLSASGLTETLVIGVLTFIALVVLFGRAFCAWACPVGTIIDAIDTTLRRLKFKPLFTRQAGRQDLKSKSLLRNEFNKYAIMIAGLTGSALFGFPFWCVFCPIGTLCRGAAARA
jgi:ferredoxin-type protein NapH